MCLLHRLRPSHPKKKKEAEPELGGSYPSSFSSGTVDEGRSQKGKTIELYYAMSMDDSILGCYSKVN